jgi:DDE domain
MLAERGIDVSYETVRRWAVKFGAIIARKLRRGRPRPDVRWHLDEVFISINGRRLYVWRAVDSEGEVLDILVQPRRDRKAALKLMRKLLKKQGVTPATIVTDKLGPYRSTAPLSSSLQFARSSEAEDERGADHLHGAEIVNRLLGFLVHCSDGGGDGRGRANGGRASGGRAPALSALDHVRQRQADESDQETRRRDDGDGVHRAHPGLDEPVRHYQGGDERAQQERCRRRRPSGLA